jgi:hypothetical protein
MTESHCTQILDKKIFKHLDSLRENHSYSNSDGEVPPTDQNTRPSSLIQLMEEYMCESGITFLRREFLWASSIEDGDVSSISEFNGLFACIIRSKLLLSVNMCSWHADTMPKSKTVYFKTEIYVSSI